PYTTLFRSTSLHLAQSVGCAVFSPIVWEKVQHRSHFSPSCFATAISTYLYAFVLSSSLAFTSSYKYYNCSYYVFVSITSFFFFISYIFTIFIFLYSIYNIYITLLFHCF